MTKYLFSIFVRGTLALSGFLVFLVSAKLFGAEGRGIISYGISIFASIGLIFSLSLGRSFVAGTNRNEALKKNLIGPFLALQFLSIFVTALVGIAFWCMTDIAQSFLSFNQVMFLSLTSAYYVWSLTGQFFYGSFVKNFQQEIIILIGRIVLMLFLVLFYFAENHDLTYFIAAFSFISTATVIAEIIFLLRFVEIKKQHFEFSSMFTLLKSSKWPHIDFLSFNLFPLLLLVISGWYVQKDSIGRAGFAIQIINLIFLFATTANIRISSYVSDVGFRNRMSQIKKIFLGTVSLSIFSVLIIAFGLKIMTELSEFSSFSGVTSLFLFSALAIPGYIAYQFFNPIWLEMGLIKESAVFNFANSLMALLITPLILSHYHERGILMLFSLFHIGLLGVQLYLYKKHVKN